MFKKMLREMKLIRIRRNIPIGMFSFILLLSHSSYGIPIKDVARLKGVQDVQMTGFGLVVGLRNTGDGNQTFFTAKGIVNMLRNMGIEVPLRRIRVRNVAAVMVTAKYPAFGKKGSRVDVTVSSIGDARSLEGGTLLMTPLTGVDGKVYALAQGPLSIGGMNTSGKKKNIRANHALVGNIPSGATLERERKRLEISDKELFFQLESPSFSSAVNLAKAVNEELGSEVAFPEDAATVRMEVPDVYQTRLMEFISQVENISFLPSQTARVVLNEKTGTVVAGGNIAIEPVAISHGNITIEINSSDRNQAVAAQSMRAATTQLGDVLEAEEPKTEMKVLPSITNVTELAGALNTLGLPPRDIISIFLSLKKSGALHAELITM